jgi:hypothetical protein
MPKSKRPYDPSSEELQPLAILARQIPNRDGDLGVNAATVWRWQLRGIKGQKLRTLSVGGIRMSCGLWLSEFFSAVTVATNGESAPAPTSSRQKQIEAAEKELAAAGI